MSSLDPVSFVFRLAMVLLCLSFPHQSRSETNNQELRAAVFDFRPLSYYNKDDELTGVLPDFIELLSRDMGVNIKMERIPYSRMLKRLNLGESDFGIFFHSEETRHIVESLVKIDQIDIVVVGRKGTEINRYDDMNDLRIAIPRGIILDNSFDSDQSLNVTKVRDYQSAVRLLVGGRVDAIVGPQSTLLNNMANVNSNNITLGTPYRLWTKEVWLRFSRRSQNSNLKARLIQSTEKLVKQGHYKRIFDEHMSK